MTTPRSLPALLLAALLGALWAPLAPRATAPLQRQVDLQAEYTFGEAITFHGSIQAEAPVLEAVLFFQSEGKGDVQLLPLSLDPQGAFRAEVPLGQQPLRAFSNVSCWLRVQLANGQSFESSRFSFYYEDNRFPWQLLEDGPFQVRWYEGDLAFAREVLNVARAGLLRAQDFLPLSTPEQVKIYVYGDAQAMQAALLLTGQNWAAGHADPALGVILVSLPAGPEQHLEMERQVPHELLHVALYHAYPAAYGRLPAWFIEGLASITELYPNPDYQVLLENAYQEGSLLSISSLCQVLPRDAGSALMAYAQAASFTRFLYRQFGTPGLEELVRQYGAGLDCERGVERALQDSLPRLENRWRRETFAENPWLAALDLLLPWLVLLLAILAGPFAMVLGGLKKKPAGQAAGAGETEDGGR